MAATLKSAADQLRSSRYIEAEKTCRELLAKKPGDPQAMHFLGLARWNIGGDASEAADLLRRAMAKLPNQSALHHNLAGILAGAGETAEAENHYRKAIELEPGYAEAYFNMSGTIRFTEDDTAIAGMKRLYADPAVAPLDREYVCYALSKAHDDIGANEEAFHFALEGSRFKQPKFDLKHMQESVAELRNTATADRLAHADGRGNPSQAPIFIVGMPRSGTTLTEQVLSRHSDVFGGGELPSVGSFHTTMHRLARAQWGYKGKDYGFWPLIPNALINTGANGLLEFIAKKSGGGVARFTDKMPVNAFHLGLITMMFPNARIIHVQRNPIDTCVSCFMQRFREGQEFSYRLDWLGQYYRLYVQVMDHWRKVLPLDMLEVCYEDFVAEPEAGARRLIDFAGLTWQDECADPSAGNREVRTASRWQVRQPVYSSSVERWRRYEAYLGPLIEALGGHDWIERHIECQRGQSSEK